MEKSEFEFYSKVKTIQASYEINVAVYTDKVIVTRKGRTGGLPEDLTIRFRDTTSVSFGAAAGRSWVTFTVPGAAARGSNIVTAVTPGTIAMSGPYIPYNDPCSLVFGLWCEDDAKQMYKRIKRLFEEYKQIHGDEQAVVAQMIHQDSAVDKLKKLKDLKDLGILSDEEFEEKRKKLLDEI